MLDILPFILVAILATIATLAILAAMPIAGSIAKWRGEVLLTLLPYCMIGPGILSVIISGRDLGYAIVSTPTAETRNPFLTWIVRFVSVYLLLASSHVVFSEFSKNFAPRRSLFLAFVCLWLTTALAPAMLSAHPELSHEYFYCLFIGAGLILMSGASGHRLVCDARSAIVIFVLCGLIVIPIKPSMVLDLGYSRGIIPGVARFAGFASHPVSMGLISAVGLLCWFTERYEKSWQNAAALTVLVLGLFLAQSKTGWIAAFTSMAIMRAFSDLRGLVTDPWRASHRFFWMAVIAVVMAIATIFVGLTVSDVLLSKLTSFSHSASGAQLMSLTGRDVIWAAALQEWRAHPVFGYGPSLFDEYYRILIGMPFAAHGHNQIVDTLARSGSVGAFGVIVYYIMLTYWSFRVVRLSRGLSVALWMLVTLQCVSEIPLQLFRYGPENIPHFVLLGVVASHILRRPRSGATISKAGTAVDVPMHARHT